MFNEDQLTRQEIKKLHKQVKKAPLLFARLGECYTRLGDYDRAGLILQRGTADFPEYLTGLLILSEYYLYKGLYRDAEDTAFEGLKKQPNHLGLLRLMIKIKRGQENSGEIAQIKSTINALDPLYGWGREIGAAPESEPPIMSEPPPADAKILASPAAIWKVKAAEKLSARSPEPVPVEPEGTLRENEEFSETEPLQKISSGEEILGIHPSGESSEEPKDKTSTPKPKIATKTLGELYAKQNNYKEAIDIYEALAANEPENQTYRKRLEELKQRQETLLASQKD